MGCHTHYRKLITNNQEEVIQKIKDTILISRDYYWYEFTTLEDLFKSKEEWKEEIADYIYIELDLREVNGVFGIYNDSDNYQIDEPRIGNYPETIITSAEEMFKAMETGLTGYNNIHCNFYWDEDRDKQIRNNIIEFFKEHPDGIIEFG